MIPIADVLAALVSVFHVVEDLVEHHRKLPAEIRIRRDEGEYVPVQKQLEIVEEFGLAVIAMARQATPGAAHKRAMERLPALRKIQQLGILQYGVYERQRHDVGRMVEELTARVSGHGLRVIETPENTASS